jgi:hypothetical protein
MYDSDRMIRRHPMAISDKEAALRIIEQLPDDATLDEIAEAIDSSNGSIVNHPGPRAYSKPPDVDDSRPAERRPVKKGFITVLEATRPLPPISVEMVNYIIEQMRREREDRIIGLADDE